MLTQTVEPRRRTALFARYSVIGSLAGALGVLAASFPDLAAVWTGWTRAISMQFMFALYAALGIVALVLYRPLSPAIEMASEVPAAPLRQSRRLVYGLAALFGMDSFGTGFLVQSLLALWLYQSFQISVTTAAAILFWSGVCSAISYLVAVPIAKRIGLINTMVFTHLPSNLFLILIPFAPDLATAIGLLLARSALSQMDVPTRASYVMAVVAPEERPVAASITAVPKTFAWAAGSIISLPVDALELWLAAAHRRRNQRRLRYPAADQVSEGASARGGGSRRRLDGRRWSPVARSRGVGKGDWRPHASRWRSAATSSNSQSRKATILGNDLVALGQMIQ